MLASLFNLESDRRARDFLKRVAAALKPNAQPVERLAVWEKNWLSDFRFMKIEETLIEFNNIQGGCERIKNTPFLRQFSFFSRVFVFIHATLLPFAFVVQRLYNFLGNRRADQLMEKLKEPLAQCRLASVVPELLDFVVWLESSPLHVLKRPLHDALVRLLPRANRFCFHLRARDVAGLRT